MATGREVTKDAVLDANNVMVSPTEYMAAGTLLADGYDQKQLIPGQNDVDSDYWELVCKNKGVRIWLACGYLVNRGEGSAVRLVSDIDSVDTATAKLMIVECRTMSALTAWGEGTESLGLKKLIAERKSELVSQADGRVRGARNPETDLGTFGDGVTDAQVAGRDVASHGTGEARA